MIEFSREESHGNLGFRQEKQSPLDPKVGCSKSCRTKKLYTKVIQGGGIM